MPANPENSVVAAGLENVGFHSNAKECSNCHTIVLISHASKVMLKILQARLQQNVNCEIPDVQAEFSKGRGTRDSIVNICWIIKKAREFQENIYFCFMTTPKTLTVQITTNWGQFLKRWEYQTTLPASWVICTEVKKQQLKVNMKQQTGSKSGKVYVKAVYCHSAYLTCMQVHYAKCWAGWSTRWNQDCQ